MYKDAISFEALGSTRHIRFSFKAQRRFEQTHGQAFIKAYFGLAEGADEVGFLDRIVHVFQAGLEDSSEEEAIDIIDEIGRDEAGRLIREAVRAAFPAMARAADRLAEEASAGDQADRETAAGENASGNGKRKTGRPKT